VLAGRKSSIVMYNHNVAEIGTFNRCYGFARNLADAYRVTLVTCNPRVSSSVVVGQRNGVRLVFLPRISPHVSPAFRAQIPMRLVRIASSVLCALSSKTYSVHAFAVANASTAFPTLVSRLYRRIPFIADWDDLWGTEKGFASYHGPIVRSIMTTLESSVPLLATRVTAVSAFLAQWAARIGVRKELIHVIPNGTNADLIRPLLMTYSRQVLGISQQDKIVVYEGGSSTPTESIILLVDSFRHVIKAFPSAKLIFVGVESSKAVRELISRHGFEGSVQFLPRQPYDRIPLFLSAANVLALPLEGGFRYQAGVPGRLGDYLCSGRAIVASAVGDTPKLISKVRCGLIVHPGDPEEFSGGIVKLLQGAQLAKQTGLNARRLAESISWRRMSMKLATVYKLVLE